ncbi:MAG: ABC transporter ATP-binding protein [Burkholderiaceae bacterium]|nr:ABC transporter ATP-binding protein [Burkholderiaceae bacterium]MDO9089604.1 ABC transporter ATP-binding protein [Burkholderiaceae bacterium]
MLEVSHLNVWRGATEVLRDVSFQVPKNTIVALLGGNGSGKSTLLHSLSGLIRPKSGSIRIDGKEAAGLDPAGVLALRMAQVPQGREVFASMTVRENLELGAALLRDSRRVRELVSQMLDRFPMLAERSKERAGMLSGGQQQQLAIARALMAQPDILMMDEPSAGLAPVVVDHMIETILDLKAQGLTILLVEQNVGVAAAVASYAHVLQGGCIGFSSPAEGLLDNPELVSSYLGR